MVTPVIKLWKCQTVLGCSGPKRPPSVGIGLRRVLFKSPNNKCNRKSTLVDRNKVASWNYIELTTTWHFINLFHPTVSKLSMHGHNTNLCFLTYFLLAFSSYWNLHSIDLKWTVYIHLEKDTSFEIHMNWKVNFCFFYKRDIDLHMSQKGGNQIF